MVRPLAVLALMAGFAPVGLLVACSSPPPPPSLAQAQQALSTAQAQGANQFAPEAMQTAAERLKDAQTANANDRNIQADRLAQESIVNSQLAEARTAEAQAEAAQVNVRRAGGESLGPPVPQDVTPLVIQPVAPVVR